MALKPGPKRTATSTGQPDKRQRDNKDTPGNTPSLKPPKRKWQIVDLWLFKGLRYPQNTNTIDRKMLRHLFLCL